MCCLFGAPVPGPHGSLLGPCTEGESEIPDLLQPNSRSLVVLVSVLLRISTRTPFTAQ